MSHFVGPIACRYLMNFLPAPSESGTIIVPDKVWSWIKENASGIGLGEVLPARPRKSGDRNGVQVPAQFYNAIKSIAHRKPQLNLENTSKFEQQLAWVAEIFKLDEIDQNLLGAMALFAGDGILAPLMIALDESRFHFGQDEVNYRHLVKAGLVSERFLRKRLHPRGTMLALGLIEGRGTGDFAISSLLRGLLENSDAAGWDLVDEILPALPASHVAFSDFAYMKEDRDFARNLIAESLHGHEPGTNLFFYGDPGTGKTALAIALASELGLRPVLVGEASEQGSEPTRSERIAAFIMLKTIAERKGGILLIVDEAEDIFVGVDNMARSERSGSKAYMNRLLSENSVPTIFITNHPNAFGPASLRRMLFAIRFREPPAQIRGHILKNVFERRGVSFDEQTLSNLANDIRATSGFYDSAARVTALIQGNEETFRKAATSILNVMGDVPSSKTAERPFSVELLNANIDLDNLANQIAQSNCHDLSILASGAPGTGKSAYVRNLAERLGMETIERTASDILGKYVGETEKAIALAFEEAKDRRAFLIFDEVDSLIRSREHAERSWEITLVNEMLSRMEAHHLPIACTTNAPDFLDPAAARRFVFKLGFEALDPSRIGLAFAHFFGVDAPTRALSLQNLTPGDFMVVKRKMKFMGNVTAEQIATLLAEETLSKPAARRRPIGFLAA